MLAGAWGACTSASVFRRDVLNAVGGNDTSLRIAQDLDLLFKVGRHTTIEFVPTILAEYRLHPRRRAASLLRQ